MGSNLALFFSKDLYFGLYYCFGGYLIIFVQLFNKIKMSVNVFTEWAPLKEVIIGSCLSFNFEGFDNIFHYLYQDHLNRMGKEKLNYHVAKRYLLERESDLDNFQRILEKRGIKVRRPRKIKKPVSIKTPFFKSIINPVDAPRDMFLCLGDEIIETPPTNRKRYFEGMMLHDVFKDYFRNGARWTLAPRPKLTDASFDFTHWSKISDFHNLEDIDFKFDIAFDAANCLKFGKDILINIGHKNHELGAVWLQRHLGQKFRVNPVRITDMHIDGMLMPLSPGVLLINKKLKSMISQLPKPLQNWKMIEVTEEHVIKEFHYPSDHPQLASFTGMAVNVLSLDEKTVCIREHAELKKLLEKNGFDVIPIQLRHRELLGGSLHCVTLDVCREEILKDYFYGPE